MWERRTPRYMITTALPPTTATRIGHIEWRKATLRDAAGIHAVLALAGELDHPYFTVPLEEVTEDLETLDTGSGGGIVATDSSGIIVAFGMVLPFSLDTSPLTALLIGGVTPQARRLGLGRRVATWQREFGFEWLASVDSSAPRRLMSYVDAQAVAARATLAEAGFVSAREYLHLRRPAATKLVAELPKGFRIESFSADRAEDVRSLRNAAFEGQWGAHSLDRTGWAAFTARPVFDSALSRVVLDENRTVVGYTLVEVDPAAANTGERSSSYLASLGVSAGRRRQGIGAALLSDLVAATRKRGLDDVTLDVDSESDSRANDLYFRLGFETAQRRFSYIQERTAP